MVIAVTNFKPAIEYGYSPPLTVEAEFECIPAEGEAGGILLRERKSPKPYPKFQDEEGPEEWSRQFDTSSWGLFLACDGDALAGGAAVATPTDGMFVATGGSDIAVLWDIRVQKAYRRQSVGTHLLHHCVSWARRRGFSILGIETQNVNVPACRFYEKHGCQLVEIKKNGYSGHPEVAHETMLIWHLKL